MTWTCFIGQPLKLEGKYEGKILTAGGVDTPISGLVFENFSWVTTGKIHLGKGFHVAPDLPSGITHYGPPSSCDLELVLTGPGLPASGKRVSFQWALSTCFAPTAGKICKQFMNTEVVTSQSGASEFTIEFASGYTEQTVTRGWNIATWTICYDGPFEVMKAAPLPSKWGLGRIPLWVEVLVSKLEESRGAPNCHLNMRPPCRTIEGVMTRLSDMPVAQDIAQQSREIVTLLADTRSKLQKADSLTSRSNKAASEAERRRLRAAAKDQLGRARDLNSKAIVMLSEFQAALGRKR